MLLRVIDDEEIAGWKRDRHLESGQLPARQLFDRFHDMITSPPGTPPPDLGKLAVFAGVRDFPTRVKCASLAWHTMKAATAHSSPADSAGERHVPVSTE